MSRSPDRAPRGRRGIAFVVVIWWALSAALWLVLAGTLARSEVLAAIGVGAVAAAAAVVLRDERDVGARPRVREVVRLWRPLPAVPKDLWRLVVVLVQEALRRERRGASGARAFAPTGADDRHAAARRALLPAAGSLAPNTYVVGIDTDAGLVLVHQLVPTTRPAQDADPLELT